MHCPFCAEEYGFFHRVKPPIRCILSSIQLLSTGDAEAPRNWINPANFLVNLVGGLIAYGLHPKEPSLGLASSSELMLS